MKNKQRGFVSLSITIITILALVAGGTYFMTREKQEVLLDNTLVTDSVIEDNKNDEDEDKKIPSSNPPIKESVSTNVNANPTQNSEVKSYIGSSYGFSYPSGWEIWEINSLTGDTIVYPKSKTDQVMNKTISTTDRVNISLVDNVDLSGAIGVVLDGETWYVKTYKGPFDGGSEDESVSYFKVYNSTKHININSGMSNKATIELIASSWKQG